ncbi:MAG: outer membrane beta-barrel protein [Flavobacteriales bacterium]|nr:outer membrane beta-barrel protein [Flavobacteriales bacterium]
MKKTHLLALIAILSFMFSFNANAQSWTVSGEFSFWHEKGNDNNSFGIGPNLRYNFNKHWALGSSIGYYNESNPSSNILTFCPYARFTYFRKDILFLYLDGGIGLAFLDEKGFKAGINPGVGIKMGGNFALSAKLGFIGYKENYFGDGYGLSFKSSDLTMCLSYTFN